MESIGRWLEGRPWRTNAVVTIKVLTLLLKVIRTEPYTTPPVPALHSPYTHPALTLLSPYTKPILTYTHHMLYPKGATAGPAIDHPGML